MLANSTQIKSTAMGKNRTTVITSLNASTNNALKNQNQVPSTNGNGNGNLNVNLNGKQAIDTVLGQKLIGPKISTIKR